MSTGDYRKPRIWTLVLFVAVQTAVRADAPPTAEQLRFFENKIRPVLADRCYQCHGVKKQKADLRVDSLCHHGGRRVRPRWSRAIRNIVC